MPQKVDVVALLLERYGEQLRAVHAEAAPGDQRVSSSLDKAEELATQMRVVGRDRTYQCLVAQLAVIYKLWARRDSSVDALDFRRHLAHLLLLSAPGTGRTLQCSLVQAQAVDDSLPGGLCFAGDGLCPYAQARLPSWMACCAGCETGCRRQRSSCWTSSARPCTRVTSRQPRLSMPPGCATSWAP